jgi:hypothetical protein
MEAICYTCQKTTVHQFPRSDWLMCVECTCERETETARERAASKVIDAARLLTASEYERVADSLYDCLEMIFHAPDLTRCTNCGKEGPPHDPAEIFCLGSDAKEKTDE